MAHLFIAYHYEALETACAIQRRIEAIGYSAALNPDPQAGETWQPWIERELERAFAVLALQSPAASASPFVTYEWARALGAGIEVIPVVLGAAALHPRLGELGPLDLGSGSGPAWDALIVRVQAAGENYAAHHRVVPDGTPVEVVAAVENLSSRSPDERQTALETLAGLDHAVARAALADAVRHPLFHAVRRGAVERLAEQAGEDVLPALLLALGDEHDTVVEAAVHALSAAGDPAVPGLHAVLNGPGRLARRAAIRALATIGSAAVPALIDALAQRDWFVSRAAALALGQIGDARAVPGLIEALRSEDDHLRAVAAEGLRQIDTPAARDALAGE
ncbi:MAG: toll/interleukin-1 receptor domain-containing protein [Chloroflexi bacterium]|nr:toll/interleukin-1 receptor domain-containing protein [Chloroflexota bacterium]